MNCQEIKCSAFGGTDKARNTNQGGDGWLFLLIPEAIQDYAVVQWVWVCA